jgi:hypothetical protein
MIDAMPGLTAKVARFGSAGHGLRESLQKFGGCDAPVAFLRRSRRMFYFECRIDLRKAPSNAMAGDGLSLPPSAFRDGISPCSDK